QIGLDRVLVCGITVINSVRAGFGDGEKDVVDTTAAQSAADEEGVEDVAYDGHRVRLSGERYREQGVHASTSCAPDRPCARHVKEPSRGPSKRNGPRRSVRQTTGTKRTRRRKRPT